MVRVRPEGTSTERNREGANAAAKPVKGDSGRANDAGPSKVSEEPVSRKASPKCYVDGQEVTGLFLMVRNQPAFLVSEEYGTWEVPRVYFRESAGRRAGADAPDFAFMCGSYAENKIGQHEVLSASLDTSKGLFLTLSRGSTLFIPMAHLSGNWTTEPLAAR